MNINHDINKYAIPYQCSQCTMNYSCGFARHSMPNPRCGGFIPDNMDTFLNDTIAYFELNMVKSKDKKLKRICTYQGATNDKVTTLDSYYVSFINDCISELHKGKMVYVFKLKHMWDILKYVDNVEAAYQGDGIIGLKCKYINAGKSKGGNKNDNL